MLTCLRESGRPLGVAALGTETGLSSNAVRFHLRHLIETGVVQAATDENHSGPGRPAVLYSALPASSIDPAAAYRMLAGLLATELSRSGPATASTEAGREWGRALVSRRSDASQQDPIGAVRDLFLETGFAPTIQADGHTVELHQCPFFELAVQQPEVVCGIHLGLVLELLAQLGSTTKVRLIPVLDGSGPCLVRLGAPRSEPSMPVLATPL